MKKKIKSQTTYHLQFTPLNPRQVGVRSTLTGQATNHFSKKGFSLIEVLVTVLIMTIGIAAVFALMNANIKSYEIKFLFISHQMSRLIGGQAVVSKGKKHQ